jgi:hypothetical protein
MICTTRRGRLEAVAVDNGHFLFKRLRHGLRPIPGALRRLWLLRLGLLMGQVPERAYSEFAFVSRSRQDSDP